MPLFSILFCLSDGPQIVASSSCNITQDLIICSCEVHGNPSPKLEWHLSSQITSTTRDESVNNTTSRSFISIHQSLMNMLTVQCVGSNKLGIDTQLFYFKELTHHSSKGLKNKKSHNLKLYY